MANQVTGVNPEAALAKLRDIHLPPPIGFWPIAPGWYVLFILLIGCSYVFYRWHKRRQVKRLALKWLAGFEEQYKREGNSQEAVLQVSDLLRRVALVYFPRKSVAGLHGKQWLDFLSKTSKNINFNEVETLFVELPYQKNNTDLDLTALFLKSRAWIKQRGAHV